MNKFIAFSFLVLGVGFYELSGGADFEPETRSFEVPVQVTRAAIAEPARASVEPPARAVRPAPQPSGVQLASFEVAKPEPANLPKIDLSKFDAPAKAIEAPQPETVFTGDDVRLVSGNRVNVRSGPGTEYGVVAKAIKGDRAEVILDDGTGWVQLRLEGGQVGWMADFLLTN